MPELTLHQIGPNASLQDLGREGYLRFGLSRGGAMDRIALLEAAALLGQGVSVPEAVEQAREYLMGAIRTAKGFGKGAGPLNHGWVLDDEE